MWSLWLKGCLRRVTASLPYKGIQQGVHIILNREQSAFCRADLASMYFSHLIPPGTPGRTVHRGVGRFFIMCKPLIAVHRLDDNTWTTSNPRPASGVCLWYCRLETSENASRMFCPRGCDPMENGAPLGLDDRLYIVSPLRPMRPPSENSDRSAACLADYENIP